MAECPLLKEETAESQIQTTYELLWSEIREPENLNSVTIFNTAADSLNTSK